MGIVKIPLRPTLRKQNLQAKEIHVLKNPCVGTYFLKSGKKSFLNFGQVIDNLGLEGS